MDYIQAEGPHLGLILGAAAIAAVGIAVMIASNTRKAMEKSNFDLTAFVCILFAIGFLVPITITMAFTIPVREQQAAAAEQANTTYGASLTREDMGQLEYPGKKPTQAFQVFGKLQVDNPTEDGFSRTETFLIWKDEKMLLATSEDGESFTELSQAATATTEKE